MIILPYTFSYDKDRSCSLVFLFLILCNIIVMKECVLIIIEAHCDHAKILAVILLQDHSFIIEIAS